ncbi:YciI family protein [Alkalihalobacillus sp. BA299]|uniref:YciI family protein n=1 Tax=Alkalihalobacillus sp. BA299 TaxID=2815938 RepID=UPI001ADA0B5F|nr:YciI family protein [Alkalihalobacillus sp. BA299]
MEKFLVIIERKSTFTGSFVKSHREYLGKLRETSLVLAGGFEDQTGGAYVIYAESLEDAQKIVSEDPMNKENEAVYKVKQWNVS